MKDLHDYGLIWVSASDFTADFNSIKKCIKAGADAIVLKTTIIPPGPMKNPQTIRKVFKNRIAQKTVFASAQEVYKEFLTIKQANSLYKKIKSYSNIKVITSFAPLHLNDFSKIPELKTDAIEINPRHFFLKIKRPYVVDIVKSKKFLFLNGI